MRILGLKHVLCVGALALSGCATGGGSIASHAISGKDVQVKSVYLEGMAVLAPAKAPGDRCLASAEDFKGKTWKQLVRHANGCAKAGDWKHLELTAQELSRVEINSPWGAYFHSLAAESTGDLPRALWMVELAMKKSPGAGLFHFQKGRVLWRLKNYKGGLDEIRVATGREPKLLDAHVFLASVHHRDQDVDKAATHYEAVLALDSRHRQSLEGLADIRMGQGKYAKAAELLTEAVSVSSSDLRLRVKLAQAHEAIDGSHELALAAYRAARDMQGRGGRDGLDVDINEKIKTLEAKVMDSKANKQAKLETPANAQAPRAPAEKKGGVK